MKKNKDTLTIGFALFAMFFGAGNLLLPPFIGLQVGHHTLITIIAFGLTGIILPFLGILSIVKSGNTIYDLGNRIHPLLAPILGTIIMLCIGPLIAIPRTGATTFEIGIAPNFPSFSPILFSAIFFGITWALSISPSKVVDIIGNILTPLLLVLLFVLILMGVINPIGEYSTSILSTAESFKFGFVEGYQTVDMLASLVFAGIIIAAAQSKGYTKLGDKSSVVISSGIISSVCLIFIYGGLVYLGATSGIEDKGISRSALLIHIAKSTLGDYGMIAIGVCIALACLTTSIALTSAVGSFFSELTGGKLSYKVLVTVCSIFSAILAILGVDKIIQFAYPPLTFVYPIAITLVLYIIIFGSFIKSKAPYIGALLASTIVAFISLGSMLGWWSADLYKQLPFADVDLGWLTPSIIGFVIGLIISKAKTESIKS
ncbi:branched-chain amino acid transport system II carrier protein [Sphingobacterium bovistauri]|uniref:Branched-chain amino acid transport system II carrier protein n=1 Tax=Sphingobacterium bovistauri TaxID=2781959 RepID=A0ABS7Z159_9SPHI|nr:branched-chain amino acid transport system II carrier protein [Sphingobacterium bovistauri]MCA5003908.1 branched-chain amino acid transport system II carrier protein [Sphingobacterium bovistauri]